MKKVLLLTLVLMLGVCFEANAATTKFFIGQSYYEVDGERVEMDVAPYIDENSRTLVPVRYVAAAVGVNDISWDPKEENATLTKGALIMVIPLGKPYYVFGTYLSGGRYSMDTEAVLSNDRLMLPARYVSQAFGGTPEWNPEERSVSITT